MILNEKELITIVGGSSSISGTLINSICKLVTLIFDIGRSIGSSIKYKKTGRTCN